MTDDTQMREFLQRMADEIGVSPVDPRPPARRARRHRATAKAIVVVAAVVAIVSAGSVGLRSITGSSLGPARQPSPSVTPINAAVFGWGGPGGYSVQAPPGWSLVTDGHAVTKRGSGTLAVSVWNVKRIPRNPCHWKETLYDPGPSVHDLVRGLEQTRIRTATIPTDGTLDGYPGTYLEWSVPADLVVTGNADFQGCDDPGNGHQDFVSWLTNLQGEQYARVAGQVDELWILEVRGHRLVVDATYGPNDSQADREDLTRIVGSLHFWDHG
jgi:hypothetical protein